MAMRVLALQVGLPAALRRELKCVLQYAFELIKKTPQFFPVEPVPVFTGGN